MKPNTDSLQVYRMLLKEKLVWGNTAHCSDQDNKGKGPPYCCVYTQGACCGPCTEIAAVTQQKEVSHVDFFNYCYFYYFFLLLKALQSWGGRGVCACMSGVGERPSETEAVGYLEAVQTD